ncbi:DUF4158 domain-containing protein [Nonomuraea guangzhouensis]|uniref:DUF4158 domain-containing protein n=1 Tax=Nonomuraea guangzhouensis TaxID=1291555 RepID=A0ABW4GUK4_9ACTN|nr:DUF4158 domain-containing protein [Nonomuraea guangzhouensis]
MRDAYEYHEYEDAEWSRRFRTFLHGRAWTHAEGPKALFDHAVGWLRRNRVLLPGVSVLARQVSEVRKVADRRLHHTSGRAPAAPPPSATGAPLYWPPPTPLIPNGSPAAACPPRPTCPAPPGSTSPRPTHPRTPQRRQHRISPAQLP